MSTSGHRTLPHKLGSAINRLRLEGAFVDGVIQVKDVEFKIHKIILSGCSPFFHAYISRWSPDDSAVLNISGLSPEIVELIIEFAYTGLVAVTEDNVQELMMAGHMLGIMDVVQICSDFLSERLCLHNCVGIWRITKICFSPRLQRKAYGFIAKHFEEVALHQEFLQLSAQELIDTLDQDELNVRKESTVYEAILRWIAHVPAERSGFVAQLLSKVRLAQTSEAYINNTVLSNELVRNNVECCQIANDAIRALHHISTTPVDAGVYCRHVRPRLPHSILLAIGGWSNSDLFIEAYDTRADLWINKTNNQERPRVYHGTAFLSGSVYCVGGFDQIEHSNVVRRFDLGTRTWHDAAPMYMHRGYVSVTVLNGCIYAIGGYDKYATLSSAESYTPETNQWKLIAPMSERRREASCTVLCNKIYVCGGMDGHNYLQTAECYDPATNQWTMIAPMNSRRSGLGVIACADHVFAVGGFNGDSCLETVEAYSPRTNTWHSVSSMSRSRCSFGIEVIDGRLFAVGGYNGVTSTNRAEYYDAATDEWREACSMGISRSYLSCCVISDLPSLTEYTVPRDTRPSLTEAEE